MPVVENLRDWLEDPRAIDQYAIRFADRTEIYWNEQKGAQKAELVYSRDNWTDSFVQWCAALPIVAARAHSSSLSSLPQVAAGHLSGHHSSTGHCAVGRAELEAPRAPHASRRRSARRAPVVTPRRRSPQCRPPQTIEFSPCEKYIVTFAPSAVEGDDPADPRAIVIWDVVRMPPPPRVSFDLCTNAPTLRSPALSALVASCAPLRPACRRSVGRTTTSA